MKLPHAPDGDPLLTVTTLVLYGTAGLLLMGAFTLAIAMPALGLSWGEFVDLVANKYPDVTFDGLLWPVLACMALGLATISFALLFIRKLLQVIRTVGEGDPFVIANAIRLQHMAWITVAIQLIGLVISAPLFVIGKLTKQDLGYELSFEGIVTILLLFILARIFRRGAEMRADLEGTV